MGTGQADYAGRYPELEVLRRLPFGTMVDGELVMYQNGRPNLNAILRRHQLVHPARIRGASERMPIHYVLFDILYHQGRSLLQESFVRRRSVLVDVLTELNAPHLVLSEGIAQFGREFFERVVAQGYEGITAKHQSDISTPSCLYC